jgi:hypothetical protein
MDREHGLMGGGFASCFLAPRGSKGEQGELPGARAPSSRGRRRPRTVCPDYGNVAELTFGLMRCEPP